MPLTSNNEGMNIQNITEKILLDNLTSDGDNIIFAVDTNGQTVELDRGDDPYGLIHSATIPNGMIGVALRTMGWAAPLNANGECDGAPSQHPDRVRVSLVVVRTTAGFCSGIKFENRDEIEYEMEHPQGALWEALGRCLEENGL